MRTKEDHEEHFPQVAYNTEAHSNSPLRRARSATENRTERRAREAEDRRVAKAMRKWSTPA